MAKTIKGKHKCDFCNQEFQWISVVWERDPIENMRVQVIDNNIPEGYVKAKMQKFGGVEAFCPFCNESNIFNTDL